MRFLVRHHSWYRYDVPVALGRHVVRLTPRADGIQLHAHQLRVVPEPGTRRATRDAHGNQVVELSFLGTCRELRVESEFELDTSAPPEVTHALPPLPWALDEHARTLGYYGRGQSDNSVRRFAEALASEVSHAPLAFLDHLTHALYTRFDRRIRTSGSAHSAAETLQLGSGACRDLTVLFMEACRCLGIASRFVSGYQAQVETVDGQRYLHAWPEVSLPEIGFRGWDPTHGVRVGDGHIALCAAPEQSGTMPIEGGFAFSGAIVNSTLDFSLHIETR